MKCERISGSLRLSVQGYEHVEQNTIVRLQMNPCIIPSRYYI